MNKQVSNNHIQLTQKLLRVFRSTDVRRYAQFLTLYMKSSKSSEK